MPSLIKGGAHSHAIRALGPDNFRIYWTVDRKHPGSRLRYPTTHGRTTDRAGAERFAKKWGVKMPPPKKETA